jgi:hypothetical protein
MAVREKCHQKEFDGLLLPHDDMRDIFYNPLTKTEIQDGSLNERFTCNSPMVVAQKRLERQGVKAGAGAGATSSPVRPWEAPPFKAG